MSSMLDDLTKYYMTSGIAAEHFRCPMADSCRSVCTDFIPAREAFVGSEYELGTLPRLLFISLDPAKDLSDRDPSKRTLQFMRHREASISRLQQGGRGFRRGDHWYQTYKFAYELLEPVARMRSVDRISFSNIHRHFAHTNSAKCKDTAKGTTQGHPLLFKNCRQFIPDEVMRLRPDVIVTQGAYARDSIKEVFRVLWRGELSSQYHAELIEVNSRPALKLSMSHPKARYGRYQREVQEAWRWYMQVGHKYLLKGPEAL